MTRLWPRSLAGQAIALQILVVAVVVLAGSALALLDARRDADEAARQQVLGIATSHRRLSVDGRSHRIRQGH